MPPKREIDFGDVEDTKQFVDELSDETRADLGMTGNAIGAGAYGIVYPSAPGVVVKISKDDWECKLAERMEHARFRHIVKVLGHRIVVINGRRWCLVYMERLRDLTPTQKAIAKAIEPRKMVAEIIGGTDLKYVDEGARLRLASPRRLRPVLASEEAARSVWPEPPSAPAVTNKLIREILRLGIEMREARIEHTDLHVNNLMRDRRGTIKLIDLESIRVIP